MTTRQTLEPQADNVLKHLRGYMYRQAWTKEDRDLILSILVEWANEVDVLERQVASLRSENAKLHQALTNAGKTIGVGYEFAADC